GWIVKQAAHHFNGDRYFIGGHPMAGSEKGGWENADAHLFENAAYVLTPASNPPAHSLESLANLLQTIGGRVIILDPEEHDRLVAEVSHLPQLLAIALTNFSVRDGVEHESRLQLAAGGFRDMTRIAASRFSIWQDILNSNRANVRQSLQEFIAVLQQMARDLDDDNLEAGFRRANQLRRLIAPP
ncbi:MAG: prephenate dehydrogenase, partial [bacterium]